MTLSLDHLQRLNLIVLLGQQECNVAETRAIWKMLDLLALEEAEREAIDYTVKTINGGGESYFWNPAKTLPPRAYDFSESDLARLQRVVYGIPKVFAIQARPWLEPLLAQLPEPVESNGDKLPNRRS